jgi:hypothetical protein
MLRAHLKSLTNWLTRKPASKPATRRTRPSVELLEDRQLLSASVPGFTLDNQGNLFNTSGASATLIDTGVESFALAGPGTLFDLHYTGTLERSTNGITFAAFTTGVQTLIQSQTGAGVPALIMLQNGQFKESADGTTFSTIAFGGTITTLAQGRNASGQQVLYALRSDGVLFEDAPSGVTTFEQQVQTVVQTMNGTAVPCIVFLQNGLFQQSTDGNPANVSTLNLGGTITELAQGRNAVSQQVLYALRSDGVLIEDTPTGTTYWPSVQTAIQSQSGAGVPVLIVLRNGQVQELADGVTFSTIGFGGTITELAQGRNTAGQQVLYALRSDDVLFEDAPSGSIVLATGVQKTVQSQSGSGVPVLLLLHNGQVQESADGVTLSTIDFGGTITELAQGSNAPGPQVFYALRSDGVLFEDAQAGVVVVAGGVNSLNTLPDGTLNLNAPNNVVITDVLALANGSGAVVPTQWVDESALPLFVGGAPNSTTTGSISYTDVHQGSDGDCWFMASLAEVAALEPSAIRNMITADGDGVYTVRFFLPNIFAPGGKAPVNITVSATLPGKSDGSLPYSQATPSTGLWAALVEKAFAQWQGSYQAINGGNASDALEVIMGNSHQSIPLFGQPQSICQSGNLAVLSTGDTVADSRIVPTHCYAIVGYDQASGKFTLYNPWGDGAPGSTVNNQGQQVYGDTFTFDATQLGQNFYELDFATP